MCRPGDIFICQDVQVEPSLLWNNKKKSLWCTADDTMKAIFIDFAIVFEDYMTSYGW